MHEADISIIIKYFPHLSERQQQQFAQLYSLYCYWNARINVISRRDIEFLYEHHVLHSLAIAKCFTFPPHTAALDAGTGGGFPGIPLAILFPQTQFTMVDSVGKKIMVVQEIAQSLQLCNVTVLHSRFEDVQRHFDFAVSRAVSSLQTLTSQLMSRCGILFCFKGGDISAELQNIPQQLQVQEFQISQWFDELFFAEKKILRINGKKTP